LVTGSEVRSIDAPVKRERLIQGPEGVSIRWPDGTHRTVRYADLAAVLRYEDGGLWDVLHEVTARLPEHLLLDQGSRDAGSIPRPTTTFWQRLASGCGSCRTLVRREKALPRRTDAHGHAWRASSDRR
jgi:hypothetical protein